MATRITIPETATIKNCPSLASEIRDAILPGEDVEISAEGFAVGDLTTVQIVLSAQKSATAVGCRLSVTNPSPDFRALFRQAGVESI